MCPKAEKVARGSPRYVRRMPREGGRLLYATRDTSGLLRPRNKKAANAHEFQFSVLCSQVINSKQPNHKLG